MALFSLASKEQVHVLSHGKEIVQHVGICGLKGECGRLPVYVTIHRKKEMLLFIFFNPIFIWHFNSGRKTEKIHFKRRKTNRVLKMCCTLVFLVLPSHTSDGGD